ncbi:hypothetical protein RhiirC2_743695 [Rhizophagus irregularis]|uniref:Uncharacterized protein n=1 Tax=Rhizophagus irregularis TaxID=588596 RepID=A0A2N1NDF1_9GLOM|nr:hypothetical protein RhiirC2_743695 [Rhizophagus irregularis]
MIRVNIRKFKKDQTKLDPPEQIDDLIHKCSFLYVLVLPNHDRLILRHLQAHWFRHTSTLMIMIIM